MSTKINAPATENLFNFASGLLITMKFSFPFIGHTFENNIKYFLFSSFICYVKYILGYPGFGGEVGAPG